jgi:hypothetical protein
MTSRSAFAMLARAAINPVFAHLAAASEDVSSEGILLWKKVSF